MVSIYYLRWILASQIFIIPSSPPVTTIAVFKSKLSELVTLIQFIGTPGWAYSFRTKYFELQYVDISPKLLPKITSDYIEWPNRYEMKSKQSSIAF